jgi:hypothetical protein
VNRHVDRQGGGRDEAKRGLCQSHSGVVDCLGFDAQEALGAVSHVCAVCKKLPIGAPTVILMDVQDGSHTWWCRRGYSDKIRDDSEDNRAGRKKDGEP